MYQWRDVCCLSSIKVRKNYYSFGYSLGLYILTLGISQKNTKKRGDRLLLWKQFASDSLPRGCQPPLSLKNEPPYSFFAADLLVASGDLMALVVYLVWCDV